MFRGLKRFSALFTLLLIAVIIAGVAYLNTTNLMGESEMIAPTVTPLIAPETQPVIPPPSHTPTQPPPTQTTRPATAPVNSTPTPSLPPTQTPARTPGAQNNTLLETLPDGATRFTDLTGGYSLTFPPGWTVIRINQEEFTRLSLNEALNDPALQRFLISLQQLDPNAYRVFALQPDYRQPGNDQITFIEVRLDTQETITVDQLRAKYYQFFKNEYKVNQIITNDMARNSSNLRFGLVEGTVTGRAATGQAVAQYIKTALLTPYNRQQLRISLVALETFRYDVGPVINQVLDTYQETSP